MVDSSGKYLCISKEWSHGKAECQITIRQKRSNFWVLNMCFVPTLVRTLWVTNLHCKKKRKKKRMCMRTLCPTYPSLPYCVFAFFVLTVVCGLLHVLEPRRVTQRLNSFSKRFESFIYIEQRTSLKIPGSGISGDTILSLFVSVCLCVCLTYNALNLFNRFVLDLVSMPGVVQTWL